MKKIILLLIGVMVLFLSNDFSSFAVTKDNKGIRRQIETIVNYVQTQYQSERFTESQSQFGPDFFLLYAPLAKRQEVMDMQFMAVLSYLNHKVLRVHANSCDLRRCKLSLETKNDLNTQEIQILNNWYTDLLLFHDLKRRNVTEATIKDRRFEIELILLTDDQVNTIKSELKDMEWIGEILAEKITLDLEEAKTKEGFQWFVGTAVKNLSDQDYLPRLKGIQSSCDKISCKSMLVFTESASEEILKVRLNLLAKALSAYFKKKGESVLIGEECSSKDNCFLEISK
ncbi:MAG: hypothetical protein HRU19_26635 [Pseudobacteriovorax sp.]|nr:hypothetical protein [Pseudobacteriovorax sp.]